MVFVWYPTGVRKDAEAAIATVTAKGLGSSPAAEAVEIAIGNTSTAAALFVTNSVRIIVTTATARRVPIGPTVPEAATIPTARISAIPELRIAAPRPKAAAIKTITSGRPPVGRPSQSRPCR